jgi:anti-sigma factor ChrR (cupin superfamily)
MEKTMRINADFSKRAAVHFAGTPWTAGADAGVERKMLDRTGGAAARATTIVRIAPGSAFDARMHAGGEEYLVLDGVFQDEMGDFPVGSYVRNPPAARHAPAAAEGAVLLVKRHQFHPQDRRQVRINTSVACDPVQQLHHNPQEEVMIETWGPGAHIRREAAGGLELFVLAGSFAEGGEIFGQWDWLRLPPGAALDLKTGADGARIWMKLGHLRKMLVS